MDYGFTRIAAGCPPLELANPTGNARHTAEMFARAEAEQVAVLVLPEMGLCGYTCQDLFLQRPIITGCLDALLALRDATKNAFTGLALVGLPLLIDGHLYNCAAALHGGRILGVVPKSYLPNYKEFYDARFFAPASALRSTEIRLFGEVVPVGTDLVFAADDVTDLVVGVEICEDLWSPVPPSSLQAVAGATVLCNLSASNELVGKAHYRRELVTQQSARCVAAYIYAGAGPGESSTDLVFGGHCLIAENGTLLGESPRFTDGQLLVTEIDRGRLVFNRAQIVSFAQTSSYIPTPVFRRIGFELSERPITNLSRRVEAHPFVPADSITRNERCEEVFAIQTAALARRLTAAKPPIISIGVSGGLDSTLALIVLAQALEQLGWPPSRVRALTMPGFGTTGRTRENAISLAAALDFPIQNIDIRPLAIEQMRALEHAPFGIALADLTIEELTEQLRKLPDERRSDLVFENTQARLRTSLLMNAGFVVGTGDLSELALGWCTYNADQMSMYNPNASIPKTLVRFLVRWAAENRFEGEARRTLLDIAATEISPELLPADASGRAQSTEDSVGPYELIDFFLYHMLRYGMSPKKIEFLAKQAKFERPHTADEIHRWLKLFVRRFFANQFKRSAMPDGPKVGSVSLSPRGDWRMPSDASAAAWLAELDEPS